MAAHFPGLAAWYTTYGPLAPGMHITTGEGRRVHIKDDIVAPRMFLYRRDRTPGIYYRRDTDAADIHHGRDSGTRNTEPMGHRHWVYAANGPVT